MWHLDPSSRLATIKMGRKLGGSIHFLGGGLGPIYHKVLWVAAYLHAECHLDPSSRLATMNMMGREFRAGGSAPFWGRGAGSPSNTKSAMPRPTFLPSGILIHTAIWLQQLWAPYGGGELVPRLTQCVQGRGLPACQV